ncbi:hypothetical protein SYK_05200 [Pseudodesulfovibrio nedwellii]|uniref:Anti-bacteriophage protein A/HamA C-terminal domain-containing protein n=1 Tax=Pseudodesulfovibrio nedwellii TaxID=2973072 RepID=A0ABM8AXB9_9BACT|nr:DUF1837 domain-containing protein [Pseudodesulfovibrio nedwellii]BDQ36160.1 hypothetical protein SYK_05200 [Pseudodesulfovibrio nedwellii]
MPQLKTQLDNAEEIRAVLQEVGVNWTINKQPVDARMIYLPCADGKCDTSTFFELIENCLLTKFVYSHDHIEKKLDIKNPESAKVLFRRAVRKLSQHTAKGELGELILFTLLDVYLEAPKLLSKVSTKTSRRVPVHGADAVHAQYVDGALRLYLGESKMYQSFKSAASQATESMGNALDTYENEFDLIETYINFPEINAEIENEILSVLNPFSNENIQAESIYSPCFIGFSEPSCFEDEATFIDSYKEKAEEYISDFYTKLLNNDGQWDKTTLLMLPFSSLDDVVDGFKEQMGIEK